MKPLHTFTLLPDDEPFHLDLFRDYWVAPVVLTTDPSPSVLSRWTDLTQRLKHLPESSYLIQTFDHWFYGDVCLALLKPHTPAQLLGEAITQELGVYPFFDKFVYDNYWHQTYQHNWHNSGHQQFCHALDAKFNLSPQQQKLLHGCDRLYTMLLYEQSIKSRVYYNVTPVGIRLKIPEAVRSVTHSEFQQWLSQMTNWIQVDQLHQELRSHPDSTQTNTPNQYGNYSEISMM